MVTVGLGSDAESSRDLIGMSHEHLPGSPDGLRTKAFTEFAGLGASETESLAGKG